MYKLACIMLLFVIGCSGNSGPKFEKDNSSLLKGTTTVNGDLIIYEWTNDAGHRHQAISEGYAIMVFYDAFTEGSVPRYELASHKDKRILSTENLDEFKAAISKIAPGSKIIYYNKCGGGFHHAMDPSIIDQIVSHCKANGLDPMDENDFHIICTCP